MCYFSQMMRGPQMFLFLLIHSMNCYLGTASSLPLTAAPLFHKTPFAVIWNVPDYVCRAHRIALDYSAFQAVTAPGRKSEQFLSLFYIKMLGLYPYIDPITMKEYNGGIPQKANLTASLEKAQYDISQNIPESNSGLAVIDWEDWRPQWERNWRSKTIYQKLSIMFVNEQQPSLSGHQAVAVAKEEFQKAARSYMEDTIKLGIRQRPEHLWGYYLFPDCYNNNWAKPGYTGQCPEIEKTRNNELLWLWEASTALFPSAYVPLHLKKDPKVALFVRGMVQEALRVSALPKKTYTAPIYVYLRALFRDQSTVYLTEVDLVRTIGESAALGASGAVLWGSSADYSNKASCERLASYLDSTLNPYVANVTAAAKLCSNTLCKGNGRCVRKNPNSDDYLHLNSDRFYIQKWNGKHLAIGVLSKSDFKVFTDRFTCQCYVGNNCSASMSITFPKTPVVIEV